MFEYNDCLLAWKFEGVSWRICQCYIPGWWEMFLCPMLVCEWSLLAFTYPKNTEVSNWQAAHSAIKVLSPLLGLNCNVACLCDSPTILNHLLFLKTEWGPRQFPDIRPDTLLPFLQIRNCCFWIFGLYHLHKINSVNGFLVISITTEILLYPVDLYCLDNPLYLTIGVACWYIWDFIHLFLFIL